MMTKAKITIITTDAICFMGGGSGMMVNTHQTRPMTMSRMSRVMSALIINPALCGSECLTVAGKSDHLSGWEWLVLRLAELLLRSTVRVLLGPSPLERASASCATAVLVRVRL
jgi:hypothetical protein